MKRETVNKSTPKGKCKRCKRCKGKLVPSGDSRKNGADRKDYATRPMHQKCWKKTKKGL